MLCVAAAAARLYGGAFIDRMQQADQTALGTKQLFRLYRVIDKKALASIDAQRIYGPMSPDV
jgi:hypothetical protein